MKKTFTISTILFAAFAMFYINNASAQIVGFDPGKYYMIINHGTEGVSAERGGIGKNALGIDDDHIMEEGALLEQKTPNEFIPDQLWQIIPITDSTYRFVNYLTGMSLGLSDWRGSVPFWTGPDNSSLTDRVAELMVPALTWHGSHRAAIQTTFTEGDETQIWQPTPFPTTSTIGDTMFYRMTLAANLVDSGFAFNIWERFTFDGFRNICVFPAVPYESDLYDNVNSLYGYQLVQTMEDISSTGEFLRENINVYTRDGSIILSGDLYGKHVEVYSILGTQVYSSRINASELYIPARQGLYIVKTGKLVTKLMVR